VQRFAGSSIGELLVNYRLGRAHEVSPQSDAERLGPSLELRTPGSGRGSEKVPSIDLDRSTMVASLDRGEELVEVAVYGRLERDLTTSEQD